jgi:hypothetical protein
MDATGAIILFGFVTVLVLLGVGGYFVARTDAFGEWWEGFKERQAARAEQRRIRNEALAAQRADWNAVLDREKAWGIENPLPPGVVLERAVERMTREGWSLQNRDETTASFARDQGAEACLGCILMLFFLLPGILYLLLANKTARITLAVYPHEGGSRLVVGGDDPVTRNQLIEWARSLRDEEPQLLLESPSVSPEQQTVEYSTRTPTTLAEKLRELAELREAGLITEEEFEVKKKDLLDRM